MTFVVHMYYIYTYLWSERVVDARENTMAALLRGAEPEDFQIGAENGRREERNCEKRGEKYPFRRRSFVLLVIFFYKEGIVKVL